MILGCDGIFDSLSSRDVLELSWKTIHNHASKVGSNQSNSILQLSGLVTDKILIQSAIEKSGDNLTLVMIAFKNLETLLKQVKE